MSATQVISPTDRFNVSYQFHSLSVLQQVQQQQFRDEIQFDLKSNYRWLDSVSVYGKINSISVFLDQEKFSRSLDWSVSSGVGFPIFETQNSLGIGLWMIEQSEIQQKGMLYELSHSSSPNISDVLDSKITANLTEGKTPSRYMEKNNFSVSLSDKENKFFLLGYRHYQLKRDFISSIVGYDNFLLNYRYENNDDISAQVKYSLLDNLDATYRLLLSNKRVRRFTDSPNLTAPNTEVVVNRSSHQTSIQLQIKRWMVALSSEIQNQTENYRVTETTGLIGQNFDIQNNKFNRRNNESRSISLQPTVNYVGEQVESRTIFFVQKTEYDNPNNNRLDDRDVGVLGFNQWLGFDGGYLGKVSYQIEYQNLHQVFIHKDNSGDNYRNHLLSLSQQWMFPISSVLKNYLTTTVSSQFRIYDYDSRFIDKKSFTFRSFDCSDSLTLSTGQFSHLIAVRTSEKIQGKFFPSEFSELPMRSYSLYAIEYGIQWISLPLFISGRFTNQDQFSFVQKNHHLDQKIRQYGPVLRYNSNSSQHDLIVDLWLQFQSINENKANFLPSTRFSYTYSF